MFNLFRSRSKAVKYLLGAILVVVALSMVTYLIPGYGSPSESGNTQIVAEIGKDTITTVEAERSLRRALQGRQMPPELAQLYVPQIIDQMIAERALAYEAERLGFDVSKTELADGIQAAIPQLFPGGQFAGREAYAGFLSQQNTSIPEFEDNMRKQMLLTKLRDLALQGVIVTPAEVEKEYRRKNNKVKLEYVALSAEKLKSQVSVTEQQVQEFYAKNVAQFRTAEKRSFDMLVADPVKIAEAMTIPDAELLRAYNANIERYRNPERVRVRHILLKTTEKPAAEIPKIQAKAEDLLKQLKAGADFAAMAKKNSDDPGSAEKGGDLGWIARGQTVKNFEETAFSLKPNELSGVIKTEYGFHIIQVLEKEPPRVKPFSEVKNELADERKKQMVNDREQTIADQARAALVKSPLGGEAIAKQLGAEFIKVDKVSPGDPIPQIGVNKEFEESLSSLKRGEVSPVVQAPGNKLVVVAVTEVVPSGQAPLADVAGKIRQSLADSKVAELLGQRANDVLAKAKAENNDLRKAAKSMGLDVKTTQEFGLDGAADGIGPASSLTQAFMLAQGAVFGPVVVGEQRFVCRVESKIEPDLGALGKQRDEIVLAIKKNKARQREELFEDGVLNQLIKEGKVKKHEDVIRRVVAGYRG